MPPLRRHFFRSAAVVGIPLVSFALAYAYWRRSKVLTMQGEVRDPAARPDWQCAGNADTAAASIIFLGDSRISRWHVLPTVAATAMVNKGVGGETLRTLTARFAPEGIACRPRAIVLQSGINDLVAASFMGGGEAEAIVSATLDRFVALANACQAAGVALVLMTVIPPGQANFLYRVEGVGRLAALTERLNQGLRQVEWPGRVRLLDVGKAVADGVRLRPEFQDDTLHLQAAAYEAINAVLAPLLRNP